MNDDDLNAIEARVNAEVRRLRTGCETAVATAVRLRAERDAFRRERDTVERESEQEIARLRAELDAARKERNALRDENIRNLVNGGKVLSAMEAKVLELRTILEGRTTAPSDEELRQVYILGFCSVAHGLGPPQSEHVLDSALMLAAYQRETGATLTWWAHNTGWRLCAWPVVTPVAEPT